MSIFIENETDNDLPDAYVDIVNDVIDCSLE